MLILRKIYISPFNTFKHYEDEVDSFVNCSYDPYFSRSVGFIQTYSKRKRLLVERLGYGYQDGISSTTDYV